MPPAISKDEGLGHVGWNLEREWHLGVSDRADIVLEASQELGLVPRTNLNFVLVTLTFVSMVNFFTHVNELQL